MSNIFSTSFGINFAKLTLVWLALISLTAKINSLLFLSHPVYIVRSQVRVQMSSVKLTWLSRFDYVTCAWFFTTLMQWKIKHTSHNQTVTRYILRHVKTLKQLWNAETICFRVLFQFYFTCASVWNETILYQFTHASRFISGRFHNYLGIKIC